MPNNSDKNLIQNKKQYTPAANKDLDILLLYLPQAFFIRSLQCSDATYFSCPPMGVNILASYLISQGLRAEVIDLNNSMYYEVESSLRKLWYKAYTDLWQNPVTFQQIILPRIESRLEAWVQKIASIDASVIGFSVNSASTPIIEEMVSRLRKHIDTPIIFGGPSCTPKSAERFLLRGLADAVVSGEGEKVLLDLLIAYRKERHPDPVKGAFTLKDGQVVWGGDPEDVVDLETLPHLNISDYERQYNKNDAKAILPISWNRGCNNNCNFCNTPGIWKHPRSFSSERIVAEFRYLTKTYGVNEFQKVDSTLTFSEKLLRDVCSQLIQEGLQVKWGGHARPQKFLTRELLTLMKEAGCVALCYGIESGDQSLVDKMQKSMDLIEASRVCRETKRLGIECLVFLMLNYPGETIWQFLNTLKFVYRNRNNVDRYVISLFGVLEQSKIANDPDLMTQISDDKGRLKNYIKSLKYHILYTFQFLFTGYVTTNVIPLSVRLASFIIRKPIKVYES